MSTLLRIDSSARTTESHSRKLADMFQQHWQANHAQGKVIIRDIVHQPIPHIADATIKAFYTPVEQLNHEAKAALKLSDELIAEIKSADTLLISAPIYNLSVPSALKAWIDQIVRINHTFAFDGKSFVGLLKGRKVYLCLAYGSEGYEHKMQAMDFLKPYLQAVFSFIGFEQVTSFALEGTSTNPESLVAKMHKLQEEIKRS